MRIIKIIFLVVLACSMRQLPLLTMHNNSDSFNRSKHTRSVQRLFKTRKYKNLNKILYSNKYRHVREIIAEQLAYLKFWESGDKIMQLLQAFEKYSFLQMLVLGIYVKNKKEDFVSDSLVPTIKSFFDYAEKQNDSFEIRLDSSFMTESFSQNFCRILGIADLLIKPFSTLIISGINMARIPKSIGFWTSLSSIQLHDNKLSSLPESFASLENLENLNLENNSFTEVPPVIKSLCNLRTLNLRDNPITALPEWLSELEFLETIYMGNNADELNVPEDLVSKIVFEAQD